MDGCWEQVKTLAGQVPGIVPRHTGGTNEYKMRLPVVERKLAIAGMSPSSSSSGSSS